MVKPSVFRRTLGDNFERIVDLWALIASQVGIVLDECNPRDTRSHRSANRVRAAMVQACLRILSRGIWGKETVCCHKAIISEKILVKLERGNMQVLASEPVIVRDWGSEAIFRRVFSPQKIFVDDSISVHPLCLIRWLRS